MTLAVTPADESAVREADHYPLHLAIDPIAGRPGLRRGTYLVPIGSGALEAARSWSRLVYDPGPDRNVHGPNPENLAFLLFSIDYGAQDGSTLA